MSSNDSNNEELKKKKRKPRTKTRVKAKKPVPETKTPISPEEALANSIEFDVTGTAYGPAVRVKPKTKVKDLLTPDEVADMKATLAAASSDDGMVDIELVQVGFLTQDSLDLLRLADKDERVAFPSTEETHVPLWHDGNPPSRAQIPVYVLPEAVAAYEKGPDYQGYGDPDDIQGGAYEDQDMVDGSADTKEDETVEPTREDYERLVANQRAEIKALTRENNELLIRNIDLEWAMYRPTWWETVEARISDFFNPGTELTHEQARVRSRVWIINTAATSKYGVTGEVLLPYHQFNGSYAQDKVYRLEQTWLPTLLDDQARKLVVNSPSFRKAVADGIVTLITDRAAQRLLRDPEAEAERQRLADLERTRYEAGRPRTIADSNVTISRADGEDD